jgi:hypothetical protein
MVNEILKLREIIEKSCNFVKELHHVYLNFKYFPRELRNILWHGLTRVSKTLSIPQHISAMQNLRRKEPPSSPAVILS